MHSKEFITAFIDQHLGVRIARLLEESARLKTPPRELAEREARERFVATQQAAEHPTLTGRLMEIGLECHRRGWVPGGIIRQLSLSYFEKRAGG